MVSGVSADRPEGAVQAMSRRSAIQAGGSAGVAAALLPLLAACSGPAAPEAGPGGGRTIAPAKLVAMLRSGQLELDLMSKAVDCINNGQECS